MKTGRKVTVKDEALRRDRRSATCSMGSMVNWVHFNGIKGWKVGLLRRRNKII